MSYGKTAAYITLGCKLNFTETASISDILENIGYEKVRLTENPDIVIINTCSVTGAAESKCRNAISKVRKQTLEAKIIVTGCYAQLKPDELAILEGVDMILGNAEKFDLANKIIELENNEAHIAVGDINHDKVFRSSFSTGDRTRSFIKIQDGCNYFCSYCTIPFARGRSRSDLIANVVANANTIAKTGIKEIILTGINIGHFGDDNNETLLDLLIALKNIEGIERYRISSIEPNLVTDDIIKHIASSRKFLPHFHIPLQAGSDNVLKAMRRKYDTALFAERVAKINSLIPNACIATDIIAGFNTETDEDFKDACRFLESIDIAYMHVFTYSERPGTKALEIGKGVANITRKERSERLHAISDHKKNIFYQKNLNTSHMVLFESQNEHGIIYGFTENYIKVKTAYNEAYSKQIKKVLIVGIDEDGVCEVEVKS